MAMGPLQDDPITELPGQSSEKGLNSSVGAHLC